MNRHARGSTSSPARIGLGLASLALAGLLLLGFKTPDASVAGTAGTGGSSGGTTGTSGASGSSGGTAGSSGGTTGTSGGTTGTSGGTTSSGGTKTVDGTVVNTRYGPVEVEITVASGKVTGVTAIELPSGGRSGAISDYVAPVLSSEALTAQSANIDIVSGATYTSEAYARSLQSALDKAGI